jgi:hypothetical protein
MYIDEPSTDEKIRLMKDLGIEVLPIVDFLEKYGRRIQIQKQIIGMKERGAMDIIKCGVYTPARIGFALEPVMYITVHPMEHEWDLVWMRLSKENDERFWSNQELANAKERIEVEQARRDRIFDELFEEMKNGTDG